MKTNWPSKNWNFSYEKFVLRVEEEKEESQNWIVFQTVANGNREFGFEGQKKMKNKGNLIHADEFSFHKIKILFLKSPSSE